MKKIVIFLIVSFTVFFIYLKTIDKKIYYLAIGDTPNGYNQQISNYLKSKKLLEIDVTEFSNQSYRTPDILNLIKDNQKTISHNKTISMKNALIKADFLTISIGLNDYLYYLNVSNRNMYSNMNIISDDIKQLLTAIRKYTKEDIVFIGIYNPYINHPNQHTIDENLKILNKNLKAITDNENIHYIDIYENMKNTIYLSNDSIYPTKEGYKMIYNLIKKYLDNKTLQ